MILTDRRKPSWVWGKRDEKLEILRRGSWVLLCNRYISVGFAVRCVYCGWSGGSVCVLGGGMRMEMTPRIDFRPVSDSLRIQAEKDLDNTQLESRPSVNTCLCVSVSVCHRAHVSHVFVSLCPHVTVSMYLCVSPFCAFASGKNLVSFKKCHEHTSIFVCQHFLLPFFFIDSHKKCDSRYSVAIILTLAITITPIVQHKYT